MPSKIFSLLLFISSLFIVTLCYSQEQPIPDWAKDLGGTGESKLAGIGVDRDDNVYVAGNFQGIITIDHSGISTPIKLTSNGHYDIYIAKYTPDGKLLWAKSIGGSNLDQVNNLAVDKDANVILGLSSSSASIDCDPGAGISAIYSNGGEDALVVKLNSDGNFEWARNVGGVSTDRGHVVTTDKDGNVIFVGSFSSPSITIGDYKLTNKGSYDGFVVKYSPNGSIIWSAGFGSFGMDEIKSVKTDSNGAIAIMGYFGANINLDPRGTANIFTASAETYFIGKYTSDGILDWANKIDGSSTKTVASISIGPTNDIFSTGVFAGSINFNSSNLISLTSSGRDLFITKYNNDGATIWARGISSTATNPYSYYITVDNENNAYIGGFFDKTLTFNTRVSPRVLAYHGGRDTFFAKYNGNGDYQWAFNFGSGCTGNFGHKIDVDSKKNVLLGGAFCKTVDFNPGNCDLNLTAKHGNSDGYIAKFNQINLTGIPLIKKFELDEQHTPAIIDAVNNQITIAVKAGTDISRLKPKIETDIGILNPLSGIQSDFREPKTYKLSSNCIDYFWTVTVTIENQVIVSVCSGETATFFGESNTMGLYQWQTYSNNVWTTAIGNSNHANFQATGLTNFTGSLVTIPFRRKITLNGVVTYDSYTMLNLYPKIENNSVVATKNKLCSSESVMLIGSNATSGTAIIKYKWQTSKDNVTWTEIANATDRNYPTPGFSVTSFFRRIATSINCTTYSNIVRVEIVNPPIISVLGSTFGCSIATLTATGGTTYLWNGGSTPNQATNTFNASGTYTVIVTNTDGCSTEASQTITIGSVATAITGNPTDCNSVTLTASGGLTYLWDGGKTPNEATNTFVSSGNYNVTITDANACITTHKTSVNITPSSIPSLSIDASNTSICAGGVVEFTATYLDAGTAPTFRWFKNGIQVSSLKTYIASGLENDDEVSMEITGSTNCSVPTISNKLKINVNSLPTVSFDKDIIIENDGPKMLQPTVSQNALTYRWSPQLGLDNSNIKSPIANPLSNTIYTLTVTGPGGCSAEATIKVTVLKDIFIPNVFSPNGDGKNDQWVIRNISDYVGTKVQIFNRYGQKVFQNDNFTTPWDGVLGGKPLPVGNYYYILDLANKSKTRYKGSVTILR